jgi:hypothetical protein
LDERDNPPNENQMAEIHTNDTVFGHKESLESKRSFYASEKSGAVYVLVRLFMNDSTGFIIHDSIEEALTNIPTTTSRYLQAFCRLNNNDSLGVMNVLNGIPSEFDFGNEESDYHDYFIDYFDVLLDLQSLEKNVLGLDSVQKNNVYEIINNSDGLLTAYGRNLLMLTDGLEYHEPYVLPDTTTNKSAFIKENTYSHFWEEESCFTLYPNPAKGYITLEYNLDYNLSSPVIEVISIEGVHLNTFRVPSRFGIKIIDLRDWKSGAYIVRLSNKGEILQSSKFVKH